MSYMNEQVRQDAAYVEQELNAMAPEVVAEAYPERTYSRAFPLAAGLSPGMDSITYRHAKAVGTAKVIEPGSREVPLVEYDVIPVTARLKVIRLGMEYDTEDVRQGQHTGRPLDRDKYITVLEGHESKIDALAWVGETAKSLYGLTNHPNILRLVTSTTFDANSTPAAILAALNLMSAKMIALTNGIEKPNTLALSDEDHQYISATPFSQAGSGDTRSILEVFQKGNPMIDLIIPVHWLKAAGVGGTSAAVMYNRAKAKVEHLLAMVPTRNPVAFDGVVYRSVVESKSGGVQVKKPFSVIMLEGI